MLQVITSNRFQPDATLPLQHHASSHPHAGIQTDTSFPPKLDVIMGSFLSPDGYVWDDPASVARMRVAEPMISDECISIFCCSRSSSSVDSVLKGFRSMRTYTAEMPSADNENAFYV